jgi:hypothetical protein
MAIIREERSNSRFKQLLAPIAINADKADIVALDVTGFDSASFVVTVGAADGGNVPDDNNHLQVKLMHSNDNVNFVACRDEEVLGNLPGMLATGTFAHVKANPDINTSFIAGYIGDKRYVRPVITRTGNVGNGVIIGIAAMLQGTKYRPVQ